METFLELLKFIKARKNYILIPIIIIMFFFGALLFFTSNSAFAPFIYTLY
ncbi:DUF5989 family protein [Candidatus Pelagibacter sp.]|nr:DUF5989 family protein [Candidatus Pelagibacter sp.]